MSWFSRALTSIAGVAMLMSVSAARADYPEKPVRVIVPWAAGGTSDLSMRKLAELVSRKLGQPFVVENKPGATGVTGLSELAGSAPDGYTLALATGATVFIAPNVRQVAFDPLSDLTPIMNYSGSYHAVVVRSEAPWKTLDELLAVAKEAPNTVTYATSGSYDGAHFSMLVASELSGAAFVNVPFSGSATAMTALLGGHVAFGVMSGFSSQVNAGKLRLLALLDGDRMPEFPDVPTLKEDGIDWEYPSIMGVVGPKAMPDDLRGKLEETFLEAAGSTEFQDYMVTIQMPMRIQDGATFTGVIERESARYKKAAEDLGIARN